MNWSMDQYIRLTAVTLRFIEAIVEFSLNTNIE
jgi:hypothetical protein